MKIQKKTIFLYSIIVFTIIFVAKFWGFIKLPYNDPLIIGTYSTNEFNATNDILRYLIFILLPVFIFLSFNIFFEKKDIKKIIFELGTISGNIYKNNFAIKCSLVIILLFLILEFLSVNFSLHTLDFLHEGQVLSSAYKSLLDNSLWSGSYVTVGIFYETLSSKFIWSIFDFQSIGLSRYPPIFFTLVLKFLFIILLFKITKFLDLNIFYKNIFFIINSYISLSFLDYDIPSVDIISYREIPIILTSILFIDYLQSIKWKKYILVLLGFIAVVSMYWSIDRGLVCNLLILSIMFFLILTKRYNDLIILFLSVIFFYILSFLILGEEFHYFISNTTSIIKEMNYIHGLIHPEPFSNELNSSRATKTLISIIIILIISLNLFFKANKSFSIEFKTFLLFLSIVSFLSYIYALGRSDGPHIKHVFAHQLFFFSIYLIYIFLRFIENINKFNFLLKLKNIILFSLLVIFLFSLNLNIKNILDYPDRFNEYIKLPDQKFLNESDANAINKIKPIVDQYDCIQLFSNDAALLYLLKKKNCTKYYFIWSVGSSNNQKKLVSDLKNTKLIISKGTPFVWDLAVSQKLPIVDNYIDQNFYIDQKIKDWEILKIKN
jgi:hypothetical protein